MRLIDFKDKPGTILDAFSEKWGEHYGTIMVCELPPTLKEGVDEHHKDSVAIVIIKQSLPIKHHSRRQPRGSIGLWSDCFVQEPG